MFRDAFYYGKKPNVHPREKFARSLEDARKQSTSDYFWIINEFCDYTDFDWDFDFDFLPDQHVWAKDHNNVWPSKYKKDSGTWLCPKEHTDILVYRSDVEPLGRNTFDIQKYFIKTTLEDLVKEHPEETFWALNSDLDYSNFDFEWKPNGDQVKYVHAFGSKDNIDTHTYYINAKLYELGYKDVNYIESIVELKTVINLFFIDRGNVEANERYLNLEKTFGERIKKTRFVNSWIDTVNRCVLHCTTKFCWILDSQLDYTNFNFDYYPNAWQKQMVHVFGTQWSHWGTTYLINCETFNDDTKYLNNIEDLPNLHFVRNTRAYATNCLYDVYFIDHGNKDNSVILNDIKTRIGKNSNLICVKYENSYLKTFTNLLKELPDKKQHYIWICSSVCDYSTFDFTYICDPFAKEQLHVFPSNRQKYGDTFFVNVNKLRELINKMSSLVDYGKINYNHHMTVKRLNAPKIISSETHTTSINESFDFPYAIFYTKDNLETNFIDEEPISLWQDDHKTIKVHSTGGTIITLPREAKQYIRKEIYDYPYIVKAPRLITSKRMDVVFVSNNETDCENRYNVLTKALGREPKRVNGVQGRENALKKAAELSETDWVFVVPGKLEISKKFDFDWQPDRLQIPKHYIFYATNPLNGLCYGHMAPVMYNKKLVLDTINYGLDFTMSKEHEIVKINAGVAHYNLDSVMTWRTAFREVIKLKLSADNESLERLNVWLTVAEGLNSEYSLAGASDGVEFFNEVNGNPEELQLSFSWDWLQERFNKKYS